ncbi:hypothetical protein [Metabacillus niabensis]|uniref:hypothetical protein n=1 Tax=Metabacillus niabensis TaxID=324854 RepID=UPI0039A0AFF6
MFNKLLTYLESNPKEAIAISEGKATPLGLNAKEILDLIKIINKDKKDLIMKYWL